MKEIPTHEQLLIFSAIVEHGSFAAASKNLNIPTSSISRKLAELEHLLGAKLIHRSTRASHISNEGQYYLQQFSPLIKELVLAKRFLNESQTEPEGTLKITAPFSYGTSKLEEVLIEFQKEYPKVRILLTLRNEYQDIVAEGYDLAISVGPLKTSSLIAKKIDKVGYQCVASKNFVSKYGALENPRHLVKHPCIALGRNMDIVKWELIGPKGDEAIEIQPVFTVNDPVYALKMVKSDMGIACLPNFLTEGALGNGEIVNVLNGWKTRDRTLYAVYHHKHLIPISLKLLLQRLTGA